MKVIKLSSITVFALVVVVSIPALTYAQSSWNILDNQWFKVKLSVKGYVVDNDNETIVGKGAGGDPAYLLMAAGVDSYALTTCMQHDTNLTWLLGTTSDGPIETGNIYGSTYPELWDFGGNALVFHNGEADFYLYPTLYIKTSADGTGKVKKATISTITCGAYVEFVAGENAGGKAFGSCKIAGSTIASDKVESAVPLECRE